MQTSLDIRRLKKTDRCDRCGAAASVAFGFDESELMFCAHHYHKYSEGLKKSSAVIVGQGNVE